jgi:hypothetical membrane protein
MGSYVEWSVIDFKRIRLLWFLGIIAPLWFAAAMMLAGWLTPGYSPVTEMVSELGARGMPYADLANYVGFVPTGVFIVLFSLGLRPILGRGALTGIISGLVALTGLGVLGTGLFQCDPGCSLEGASVEMIAHALSGLVTFTFSAFTPLVMSLYYWRSNRRGVHFAYSILTSVVLIALMGLMFSPAISEYRGLDQGLFLGIYFLWIIIFALSNKSGWMALQEHAAR